MAALPKVSQLSSGTTVNGSSSASYCKADVVVPDQFDAGLRVLVVDDEIIWLRILEKMLQRCMYHVTTCSQATVALNLLRERRVMSADGRTSTVMEVIAHGACDFLLKPIREEELKLIWQHVVRKKWNENKEHEQSGSLDDNQLAS
ncbi:hypothetical protein U1Q18_002001 [Sarracenia purpurea var. burkii]